MKQIMSYSYDDDKQVKLEQLNLRIMNLEEDEALADIEELQS